MASASVWFIEIRLAAVARTGTLRRERGVSFSQVPSQKNKQNLDNSVLPICRAIGNTEAATQRTLRILADAPAQTNTRFVESGVNLTKERKPLACKIPEFILRNETRRV